MDCVVVLIGNNIFHFRVHEDSPLGVKLVNVDGDEDLWIAQELVNGQYAEPTDFFGISNKAISGR